VRETTALGAAIAAGFAVGVWKDFDELKEINSEGRTYFKPQISQKQADKMYKKWNQAVEMSKGWSTDEDEEEGGNGEDKNKD
jgi:glycerol kinase